MVGGCQTTFGFFVRPTPAPGTITDHSIGAKNSRYGPCRILDLRIGSVSSVPKRFSSVPKRFSSVQDTFSLRQETFSSVAQLSLRCPLLWSMPILELHMPADFEGDNPEVDSWEETARRQLEHPPNLEALEEGDALALLDRNDFTEEWSEERRKVFALIDTDDAYIFDEHGELIDEPANFLPGGRQPLRGDDCGGFLFELGAGDGKGDAYYKLPTAELLKTPVESASEDDEDEVDLDKIIYQGARVQVCFGGPGQETAAAFYGALVGRQVKDDEGTWWILGFDDGDVRSFKVEDLKGMLKCHSLDALDGEAGLIRNKPAAAASEFFYFENNNQKKVVGLLVGKEEERKVFDLPVFQDFYVVPNAFTPSRSGRSGGAQSTQDRLGIHTFRRGDLVLYQHGEPHETMSSMAIWGVCNHVPEGNSQARKFLVIYDMAAKTFFLGAWPAWLRIPNPEKLVDGEGGSVSFDCDNDEHVKMMTPQQCKAKWWLSGLCLRPHSSLGPSRRRRRTPRSRHLRSRPTARGRRRRRGRGRRMRTEIGRRERGRTSRWGGGRGETRNLLSGRHRLIRESAPIRATQQAGAHH